MGKLVKGAVVVVPFPFSDLSESKVRPAVVVGAAGMGDYILCMITKTAPISEEGVELTNDDFVSGGLVVEPSYVRPSKLFTMNIAKIKKTCGHLGPEACSRIAEQLHSLLCDD